MSPGSDEFTDTQVTSILKRAAAAVDEAGLTGELRGPGLAAAVGLLTGSRFVQEPDGGGEAHRDAGRSPASKSKTARGSEVLERLADGLDLEATDVSKLFAEKDGAPELIVRSRRLPAGKAAAASDIALLVMAGRQLSGIDEEYTDADVLREAVKRYGKFDQANFSATMRSLDNFVLQSGKGANARRKLTNPGIEAAAELAKKYLTEE